MHASGRIVRRRPDGDVPRTPRRQEVAMFALVVRFDCRDAAAAARFDELTAEVLPLIERHEPGRLVYATHAVESEPLARPAVQRDREAWPAHDATAHVGAFHRRKDPLLTATRVELLAPGPDVGGPAP